MKVILKLAACWVAFVAALMGSGALIHFMHLRSIAMPDNTPMRTQMLAQLGAGALLVLGLYPLARRLAAPFAVRAVAIGGFLFLALGVNGLMEMRIFTHLLDQGVIASLTVFYAAQAILIGAALGFFFGLPAEPPHLPHRGPASWAGRGIVAWLCWPVIYFVFGMSISPIVVPYYSAGIAGLQIPPAGTIFEVQLVRSLIFLGASLPFLALWKGSRRGLWLALGLAHAFTVGIYGLAAGTFLPWVLRITHSVEITADSFAYAGLLVLLLTAPVARTVPTVKFIEPHPRAL
jgi:hypothetical protein